MKSRGMFCVISSSAVLGLLLSGCTASSTVTHSEALPSHSAATASKSVTRTSAMTNKTSESVSQLASSLKSSKLRGMTVVIDPGHQLGNSRFKRKINRKVNARYGLHKKCNTTGTATNKGLAEATFNWRVATRVRDLLKAQGVKVIMTRTSNSKHRWGPCITTRGKKGNGTADLLLSIHGDGARSKNHGFHLIMPTSKHDKTRWRYSRKLGLALRSALRDDGFVTANYVRGGLRYSNKYGGLNWSSKAAVLAELGNMRSSRDAKVMSSKRGQKRYAVAIADGVVAYLRANGHRGR